MTAPTLSIVIPTREGRSVLARLDSLASSVRAVGGEIVIVDGSGEDIAVPSPVRWIALRDRDLLRLRSHAVRAARGTVVAIGEDHAVPTAGWCEAVVRAHAENPGAPVVVGCLVNGTDRTMSGRANFLAFAAPYAPPMPSLPSLPPPVSTLSFKHETLTGLTDDPGALESDLIPRLFAEGRMVADDRVVIAHHQDFGIVWAISNAFASARSGYGYARSNLDPFDRRRVARWVLAHMTRHLWRDGWDARRKSRRFRRDVPAVAVIQLAAVAGATFGILLGPGCGPHRVA